jgi:hypothetical protein
MAAALRRDGAAERRHFARASMADPRATLRARVRPGRDVRVIDYSRGGALVQSTSRLLPGSHVELQLRIGEWQWNTAGQVIRCQVWALAVDERVRYRAGVQFARPMDHGVLGQIQDALQRDAGADENG